FELAARVAAGTVACLFGVHEADLGEHAADEDFGVGRQIAKLADRVRGEARQVVAGLGERMARDVGVEGFLLAAGLLARWPSREVAQPVIAGWGGCVCGRRIAE